MKKSRLKTAKTEFRGESFSIREISYAERKEFLKRSQEDPQSAGAMLAVRCTLADDGSAVFADEAALDNEPPGLVDHLSREILRLSGVAIDDKPVEAAEKKD